MLGSVLGRSGRVSTWFPLKSRCAVSARRGLRVFILVLIVASFRGRQRWDDSHRVQLQADGTAATVIKVCRTRRGGARPAVPGVVAGLRREERPAGGYRPWPRGRRG